MAHRRLAKLAVLALLSMVTIGVLSGAPAMAKNSPNPVINDCLTHPGGLAGHYSTAELNHALQVMPTVTKDYTNCPDVINRALLAAVSTSKGNGGGGGGSGSFLPTPVLVILVVLVLAAITFGAVAIRRRRDPDRESGGDLGGPAPGV